jgi:acylpyruvate hydrolase
MKLATIEAEGRTSAATWDGISYTPLAARDVGELLAADPAGHLWAAAGDPVTSVRLLPVVPRPEKIFCVGLNFRSHILEMGRELPQFPTVFGKYANALVGAYDDIVVPPESTSTDWEAELAFVIGKPLRRASEQEALNGIAGYTVANDVSMRDWQWKTSQWLAGKTFDRSNPLGPHLVTPEEVDHAAALDLRCDVDGEVVQESSTKDLLFGPAAIASYLSQFATLVPGDVVLTGTPGGVGAGRDPQVFLHPGQVVTTSINGLGCCVNQCVVDVA